MPAAGAYSAAAAGRLAALLDAELDPAYRRRVATVVEWLPPSPAPESYVADIGCGRGYFLHYYAELGQRAIVGIERDEAIARKAIQRFSGRSGVAVVRGDAGALPLATRSCSGAIMSEVLEHVEDDVGALREAFRVLRPGGVLALTVPHANYPWAWDPINRTLAVFGAPAIRHGPLAGIWAGHRRLYDIATLRQVVEAAGFAVEDERAIVRRCVPFSHNLLYGIGKPLLEAGLLPARLAAVVDRHRDPAARAPALARALRAFFSLRDRGNRLHEGFDAPSVGLAMKLRKGA